MIHDLSEWLYQEPEHQKDRVLSFPALQRVVERRWDMPCRVYDPEAGNNADVDTSKTPDSMPDEDRLPNSLCGMWVVVDH